MSNCTWKYVIEFSYTYTLPLYTYITHPLGIQGLLLTPNWMLSFLAFISLPYYLSFPIFFTPLASLPLYVLFITNSFILCIQLILFCHRTRFYFQKIKIKDERAHLFFIFYFLKVLFLSYLFFLLILFTLHGTCFQPFPVMDWQVPSKQLNIQQQPCSSKLGEIHKKWSNAVIDAVFFFFGVMFDTNITSLLHNLKFRLECEKPVNDFKIL